jgi:hypothetical protein
MTHVLLMLIAPPGIAEALHDWLLAEAVGDFTEQEVLAHGGEHAFESAIEQVRGSQRRTMFHIHMTEGRAHELLRDLGARWPAAGLTHWLMPIIEAGPIGGS